jgi:hypothetical protein
MTKDWGAMHRPHPFLQQLVDAPGAAWLLGHHPGVLQ